MSKIACLACLIESGFISFVFSHRYMLICNLQSRVGLMNFVLDSLDLIFFHFLCYGST